MFYPGFCLPIDSIYSLFGALLRANIIELKKDYLYKRSIIMLLSATCGSNIIDDMRFYMTTRVLMLVSRTYEEKSKEKGKEKGKRRERA